MAGGRLETAEQTLAQALRAFETEFGVEPACIASAPGRVNLIGEHTDHMEGLVLPVAINRELLFTARPNGGSVINGYSPHFGERVRFPVGEYDSRHPCLWLRYVLGILREVEKEGAEIVGFDFCVTGNVPIGSGLSSSASFLVAVLTAAESMFSFRLEQKDAARVCQRAENDFVGLQCGIMDPFISLAGIRDHAIRIDCRDFSTEAVPAAIPGHTWLVLDSGKKRGLVGSEYNARILQCLEGLRSLQKAYGEVETLRDVSLPVLMALQERMNPLAFRRVRHVITENQRVLDTCDALRKNDLPAIGASLYASHASLRDDFEVSCAELDVLVETVSRVKGVVGARLTGAGFGGCAIALVANGSVEAVEAAVAARFPQVFASPKDMPGVWPIRISNGAFLIAAQWAGKTVT